MRRTATLTAELEYDGTAIIAVSVEADMTQLRSDDSRRDRTLRRQELETGAFPTASFELTSPFAIGAVVDSEPMAATVTGELTLHGVTRDHPGSGGPVQQRHGGERRLDRDHLRRLRDRPTGLV